MNRGIYFSLGVLGLLVSLSVAAFQNSPGYMDADYYFMGGLQLVQGRGFQEEILWNYLDNPVELPHPSHAYWMPLASLLSAVGMRLFGRTDFSAARSLFILMSAAIPPLTAGLAWRLYRRPFPAVLSGCFALLSGFYLPYLTTTDGFSPAMILGGIFFILVAPANTQRPFTRNHYLLRCSLLGFLAGWMHLGRADGAIWLLLALGASVSFLFSSEESKPCWGRLFLGLIVSLVGYLLVMGPWFLRNMLAFGYPLAPGGSRALFIREYDELFVYPSDRLTFQYWLSSGWMEILRVRLWAAGQNLQSTLAVQGEIILFPLILLGLWNLRQKNAVKLAVFGWLLSFLTMTVIFPFQGARGGFFHSGAGFQPLFWAVAPIGLDVFLKWGSSQRGWNFHQARLIFGVGLVSIALAITAFIIYQRLTPAGNNRASWDENDQRYSRLEGHFQTIGMRSKGVVMVNNPPGFLLASGRSAIPIPFSGIQEVCAAAIRYGAEVLLLEIDQIPGEPGLFETPQDRECLDYIHNFEGIRIFRIRKP